MVANSIQEKQLTCIAIYFSTFPYSSFHRWVVEDVVDTYHLCKDGAVTQGVTNGCQPWVQVTEDTDNYGVSGGYNCEYDVDVKNDGSYCDDVIEL